MKIIFLLLPLLAFARENPFAPSSLKGAGLNQVQAQTSILMEPHIITLPVDAVRLNKIIINYQMIDGRIENKTFIIDKPIASDKAIILEQK